MQREIAAADMIATRARRLAEHAVDTSLDGDAWLPPGTRRERREERLSSATLHLKTLSDAMLGASEQLFVDYVDWARTTLAARDAPPDALSMQLRSLLMV